MKARSIILLFAVLFICNNGFCNFSQPDTSSKPWRIRESVFIEKYGENEKAKKFIERWFTQRHLFTALSAASGAITAGLAVSIREPSQNSRDAYAGLLVAGIILVAFTGTLFTIGFFIPVLTHSRKKLYHILEKNKKGEHIPKRFRNQLQDDK